MKKIQDKFLRWVVGTKRYTPGYMVREKLQKEKLKGRTSMGAWEYKKTGREKKRRAGQVVLEGRKRQG